MSPVPLILVSSAYWKRIAGVDETDHVTKFGNIGAGDLNLLRIADTRGRSGGAMYWNFYSKNPLEPNF